MTPSPTRAKAPIADVSAPSEPATTPRSARSDFDDAPATFAQRFLVGVFVVVPLLALIAAIPLAWGWGLGWHDVVIALVFYWLTGLGVTVGFHRYFTHGSFKAKTGLRVALAVFGTMAIEGPVFNWVADHRRHHKFSDREGAQHSPWRYGDDTKALAKGLAYAHMLWLFDENKTSQEKFIPDLLADRKLRIVHKLFPVIVLTSMLAPALIGGLWSMSWAGALTAFFWASLVRVALLHHVTWSINSICHTFGTEEFEVRDKARNVSWLAIASFGESWHNLHHADPTCARHGVLKGQLDPRAPVLLEAKRPATATRKLGSMTRHRLDSMSARTVRISDETAG